MIAYTDTPNAVSVWTKTDQNNLNDGVIQNEVLYDGLGRKQETRQFADCGYISVQQTYDAMGRPYTTTNPFRPCASETAQYTTTTYDALSRPLKITSPDASVLNFAYATNTATATDPCGISHANTTDAAGRLTQVVEGRNGSPTAACISDATQANSLTTAYAYNALDSLIKVTQGTQNRTFTYDSLSRLSQATNPESATIIYTYDKNGNLLSKTDARSVAATMTYDALNRMISKTYSPVAGYTTPSVNYCYDGNTQGICGSAPPSNGSNNLIGHLTLVSSSASSTSYPKYDDFGNITQSAQTTSNQTYSFGYSYNLASALTSETYPSGRLVYSCYDFANRPAAVASTAGCNSGTYVQGPGTGPAQSPLNCPNGINCIQYASHGPIGQMVMGNGISEATTFNNRLQPLQISAGILTLGYTYPSGTNNGDISKQTITWSPLSPIYQYYQYDQFNHLHLASENPANPPSSTVATCSQAGTTSWCERYGFDSFANRSLAETTLGSSQLTPSTFDPTTNHNSGTGWGYDGAGDNSTDPLGTLYQYDAENRQISAGGSTYTYDGDGRRVSRTVAGVQSVYAYDTFGNLAAEYGSTSALSGTVYLTADHLGSTRLITSASNTLVNGTSPGAAGTAIECRDYLPFGEQILVGSGSPRLGLTCLTSEIGVRQQFTSKERDAETGLDFFGARYFSSVQGRFTSTDRVIVTPARMEDPQRFNLYSYARNNPFKFIDPTGEDIDFANDTEEGRKKALELITKNLSANEAANIGIRQAKSGSYEAYVIDAKAFGKDASSAYTQLTGLIGDHSVVADLGVIGGGLTATFKEGAMAGFGPISSWSNQDSVFSPNPGSNHLNVLVTQGDLPGGSQVWCCGGKAVYQGVQPDFVTMWHELMGETLKYRAGHENLRNNPDLDSRTVIKIENEIRAVHGMNPRTGADHGQTVITVSGKVQ